MARPRKTAPTASAADLSPAATAEPVPTAAPVVEGVGEVGPCVDASPDAANGPASPSLPTAPQKFTVTRGGRCIIGGTVHTLASGSVVSASTHDLAALRANGLTLTPRTPPC